MSIDKFLNTSFFDNTLLEWAIFFGIWIVGFFVIWYVRHIARTMIFKENTTNDVKHLLNSLLNSFKLLTIFVLSLFIALHWLELPQNIKSITSKMLIATVLFQIGIWSSHIVDFAVNMYAKKSVIGENIDVANLFTPIRFILHFTVWSVILLMALDNFGVNVTALVAGLGIGGIAVALAVQNILGDLLSSLSIVLDKPFVVGDFITVDSVSGTVERVGIKTTVIRSISGEQVVIANGDILKSRIQNFKRMEERRAVFKFGDFSLDFEVAYYVSSNDYLKYMDIQQQINLEMFREFKERGIGFAYPTQTLHVSKD